MSDSKISNLIFGANSLTVGARVLAVALLAISVIFILPSLAEHTNLGPAVTPEFRTETNPTCLELQLDGQEWMEVKLEDTELDGPFPGVRTDNDGTLYVTVTVKSTDTATTDAEFDQFDWESNIGVDGVLVKGGQFDDRDEDPDKGGHHFYRYDDPTITTDPGEIKHDDGLGVPNENNNAVSHISFCYDIDPDMVVEKASSHQQIEPGDTFTFTVTATNVGPGVASSVTVTDDLADGLTDVTATFDNDPVASGGEGSCTVGSGNQVNCPVGNLAASSGGTDDTAVVEITATAPENSCEDIVNTARVDAANEPSGDTANNDSNQVAIDVICADVAVSKSASASSVDVGGSFTFTVTGTNIGDALAQNVVITDDLKDSLTNVSADYEVDPGSGDTGTCDVGAGNMVTCTVGSLAANDGNSDDGPDTVVVTIEATASTEDCTDIENVASISASNEPAIKNGNNTNGDPVTVGVNCPDVVVAKTASQSSVDAGGSITYQVTATNTGDAPANGVVVTDDLDNDLTGVTATYDVNPGASGGTGSCTIGSGNTVTCNVGTLESSDGSAGGPDTVVVTIEATAPTAACGTVENQASVTATNEPSGNDGNNSSGVVTVTVNCPDLHTAKSASSSAVDAGGKVTYTVTVTNDGSGSASGVVVSDNLDDDLTGVTANYDVNPGTSGGTGSCDVGSGNTVTCNVGTLAATDGNAGGADTVVVTISATAPSSSCGTIDNQATSSATNESSADAADNSSSVVQVTVNCPDVAITKASSDEEVEVGESFDFKVTVTSEGAATATNVQVTDTVDSDLTINGTPSVSGATGSCSVSGNTVTCSIPSLASGASAVITISVTAETTACPSVSNQATVSADGETNTSNNTSNTVNVTVNCRDVAITKASSDEEVEAGESFDFTVTVTSQGTAAATNVEVTDTVDSDLTINGTPSVSGASGSCSVSGNTVTCSIPSLASGASAVITISVTAETTACPSVSNQATVSADGETNTSNNTSNTVNVTVNCPVAEVVAATLQGTKFNDSDGDGASKEEGEAGLSGWRIYVDINGNGQLDSGEPFDDTASNGQYFINDIDPGTYKVREVGQQGWSCKFPNPCEHEVTFSSGQEVQGIDFGNHSPPGPRDTEVAPSRIDRSADAAAQVGGGELTQTGMALWERLLAAVLFILLGIWLVRRSLREASRS